MFQLIYLTFTQPRADGEAFRVMTGQLTAGLANREAQPDTVFEDTLTAALTQNHVRAQPYPGLVSQMSLDKSMAFYKDRFADASDFTFVLVGSFDLPTIKPLVERYLGSLPSLHRKKPERTSGSGRPAASSRSRSPKGPHQEPGRRGVHWGVPEQSEKPGDRSGPLEHARRQPAARPQRGSRRDVRVSVSPDFTKRPTEDYRLTITFACDPARTQDLIKALFDVVDEFRTNGPSPGQVADAQAALRRDLETDTRQNGYLLNQLAYAYQYDEPFQIRQRCGDCTVS